MYSKRSVRLGPRAMRYANRPSLLVVTVPGAPVGRPGRCTRVLTSSVAPAIGRRPRPSTGPRRSGPSRTARRPTGAPCPARAQPGGELHEPARAATVGSRAVERRDRHGIRARLVAAASVTEPWIVCVPLGTVAVSKARVTSGAGGHGLSAVNGAGSAPVGIGGSSQPQLARRRRPPPSRPRRHGRVAASESVFSPARGSRVARSEPVGAVTQRWSVWILEADSRGIDREAAALPARRSSGRTLTRHRA